MQSEQKREITGWIGEDEKGRLEAFSLSNTRGSSNNSSNTQVLYIINSMYVYCMYYIKH